MVKSTSESVNEGVSSTEEKELQCRLLENNKNIEM